MAAASQSGAKLLEVADDLLTGRHITAALQAFDRAEQAGAAPDQCAAGRWTARMLQGEFECAWRESDAIRARDAPDSHRFWNGEPIAGKRLMVRCLHGLGDAVQMLRYLPLLRAQCAEVIVEVPPSLLALGPCFDGATSVMTWGEQAPLIEPSWDVQVEVMELPYLFRTSLANLPVAECYLHLPRAIAEQTAHDMGSFTMPRVGIVWAASEWDPSRRLPWDCLSRLLTVPGIQFWNLQGGAQHALGKAEAATGAMQDGGSLGDGLPTLAAAIANVDLVITVDTLAAHMAGALGREAWVLLQNRADWRWMVGRADSPWYPSLRLFRQPVQDDWEGLTQAIREALRRWMEGKP